MTGDETLELQLSALSFGEEVAEQEISLGDLFVATPGYVAICEDEIDLLLGPKGSGKSAIAQYVSNPLNKIPAIEDVGIVPAFNIQGSVLFRRLTEAEVPRDEDALRDILSAYVVGLLANHVAETFPRHAKLLKQGLRRAGLLTSSRDLVTSLALAIRKLRPKVQAGFGVDPSGQMKVTGSFGLEAAANAVERPIFAELAPLVHEAIRVLASEGRRVWVVFDRLDEAFASDRELESLALRALLRTYLDLTSFGPRFRMKLFLRPDLLAIATRHGGFANYSHIRSSRIRWNRSDISALVAKRVRGSRLATVAPQIGAQPRDDVLIRKLLPARLGAQHDIDVVEWLSMVTRDGSRELNPRNFISLLRMARTHQLELLRSGQTRSDSMRFHQPSLISERALVAAHVLLSFRRLDDTVLAEGVVPLECVDALRGQTVDFSTDGLRERLVSYEVTSPREVMELMVEVGLLRRSGGRWSIPTLYRPALESDAYDVEILRGDHLPDLDYEFPEDKTYE